MREVVSLTTISIITTYDQFLQKNTFLVLFVISFTVSFTLIITLFSLKIQVEALRYLYLYTLWYKLHKMKVTDIIGKVQYYSRIFFLLRSKKDSYVAYLREGFIREIGPLYTSNFSLTKAVGCK